MSKLLIEKAADEKIRAFTALCPFEISGLGKVRLDGEDIIVTDVAIFEQEVSGVHSTIPTEALAKFMHDLVQKGESPKDWCLWWHSHADMGVFFSGTDTDTISTSTEFPFLVSLVVNKKRENKARVDIFRPVPMYMALDVEIISAESDEIKTFCSEEIAAKVKRPAAGFLGTKKDDNAGYRTVHAPKNNAPLSLPYSNELNDDCTSEETQHRIRVAFDDEDAVAEYEAHLTYLRDCLRVAQTYNSKKDVKKIRREMEEWKSYGHAMGLTGRKTRDE